MQALIDYRNAKYQGEVDDKQSRNGYGILIDDDLSFYASQWSNGKLNNDTVIYISHGKYIYGQWQNNQPHGLNVFRIADTVVLGEFEAGYLKNKILVIFEKLNFISILQEIEGDWVVCESGVLKNYNQLIRYINDAKIPMKPQYFSLTKFLTSISNAQAAAVPCKDSENCYYGFQEGLGIIFNPNNGVVSIGCHAQKRLIQFGGKYQYPKYVLEGNFQTNQVIRYSNERPKQQIYSIFHKIHKRSLNFKNQYFDSKVKLLNHIEDLIRTKINEILIQNKSCVQQNTFTAHDLNDSLDYHAESLEEFNRMNKVREEVYEVKPLQMKKTTSQFTEASPNVSNKKTIPMTPKKNTDPIVNAPASPIVMKKSPIKTNIKQKEKQIIRTPTRHNYMNRAEVCQFKQQTFGKVEMQYQLRMKNSNQQNKSSDIKSLNDSQNVLNKSPSNSSIRKPVSQQNLQRTSNKPKYSHIQLNEIQQSKGEIASSKNYVKQKDTYNVPSFNYQCPNNQTNNYTPLKNYKYHNDRKTNCHDKQGIVQLQQRQRNILNNNQRISYVNQSNNLPTPSSTSLMNKGLVQTKQQQPSISPAKSPSYENLSQRRRRILNSFKNLNQNQPTPNKTALPNLTKLIQNSISSKLNMVSQNYNPLGGTKIQPQRKQKQICPQEYPQQVQQLESPYAREKFPSYESKNTQRGQVIMPLTINKQNQQPTNWRDKNRQQKALQNNLRQKLGKEPYFRNKESGYKENLQIESTPAQIPFSYDKKNTNNYNEKKIRDKVEQKGLGLGKRNDQLQTTPTRKVYKYYFDQQNE